MYPLGSKLEHQPKATQMPMLKSSHRAQDKKGKELLGKGGYQPYLLGWLFSPSLLNFHT